MPKLKQRKPTHRDRLAEYILALTIIFVIVISVFNTKPAQAAEVSILSGGWSKHTAINVFNESHKVFGVQVNNWQLIRYQNSFNSTTVALTYHKEWYATGYYDWSMSLNTGVGVATGYDKKYIGNAAINNTFSYALMAYTTIQYKGIGFDIGIAPADSGIIWTAMFRYTFEQ